MQDQDAVGIMGQETGLTFEPPTFSDPHEERAHIKERLASAFRIFAYYGYDEGLAGHITARDPIEKETFWVNPLGMHFSQIKVSDLVRLDHDGNLVEGAALINTAAFVIHSRIHAAHPDINAIAHSHSMYGKSWSTQGRKLQPLTQDSCVFYEAHDIFSQYDGVVHDQSEGDAISAKLGGGNIALILQNHGLLTVGVDVDSAASLFVQLERACETQVLVEGAQTTTEIPAQVAKATQEFLGSRLVVWGNYQPLYQMIEKLQPDFKE